MGLGRPVGTVTGKGDHKGEKGRLSRHFSVAVDQIPVQHIVFHFHVAAGPILFIAQILVHRLPVVHTPLTAVEGLGGVPRPAEQMGQRVGKGVLGIDGDRNAAFRGQEAAVHHELGVEGTGGDIGRRVVPGKVYALLF